jgi:DNA mismatch endonuclease (patch repair protein)
MRLQQNKNSDTRQKKIHSFRLSKVKSQNTKFETEFIKKLRQITKTNFVTHKRSLIGKPDIVLKNKKICIFLDSDFWHGWQYPRWKHKLDVNWKRKIEKNKRRDLYVTRKLRRDGWLVLRFWEHEIHRNEKEVLKTINKAQVLRSWNAS